MIIDLKLLGFITISQMNW